MRFPFYECFSETTYIFLTFKIFQVIEDILIHPHLKGKKPQELEVGVYNVPVTHFDLSINNSM